MKQCKHYGTLNAMSILVWNSYLIKNRKPEGHPVIFDTGKMEDNECDRLRKAHFPLRLIRALTHNYRTSAACGFCLHCPSMQTSWTSNRGKDYFQSFKGVFLSSHTLRSKLFQIYTYQGITQAHAWPDMSKRGKIYKKLGYRNNRRVSTLYVCSGKRTWSLLLECFNIVDGIWQVTAVIPCC